MFLDLKNLLFKQATWLGVAVIPLIILGMAITLFSGSSLVLEKEGLGFFFKTEWDPVRASFGSFVFLVGTILTTALALLISFPFSIAISMATGEIFKTKKFAKIISYGVEIISAVPSVVIGFWALFTIVPIMQKIQSYFDLIPYGTGLLSSVLVLSFMIIPFSAALGREVIMLVPNEIKEAAYALGATRFEVIRKVILPYSASGIFGGFLLAAGRAFGETMAVTMLIGNVNYFPENIFSPTNTMASIIANEFAEASEDIYYSALMGVGFFLLITTSILSYVGRWVIRKLVV